jgi:plastocyanin
MKKHSFLVCFCLALLLLAACARPEPAQPGAQPETAAAPAQPVDPATAATLTGKVSYIGPKPKLARIRMDAEAACAALHKAPVYSQEILLNDNGTLRAALVYIKEGLGGRSFPVPAEPVVLDQHGCLYTPHVLAVMAGQQVKILNSDPTTHNIHPIPQQNREWNRSQPPNSEPMVESFPREELAIPVKCNVHPWMKAYVSVFKHPFFATTREEGTFTITGLPPGDYTVAVWQEKLGALEQKVTVGPKESKSVDFTYSASGGAD